MGLRRIVTCDKEKGKKYHGFPLSLGLNIFPVLSIGQDLPEVTLLLDVLSPSAGYPELQSRGEGGGVYMRQKCLKQPQQS